MFKINDDLSIYVTRGDMVFLKVTAENNGEPYTFDVGEVLRIKVYRKKDCEEVVLQKDFPVTTATQEVEIILEEADTKIGDVISKPVDYWYEIELNPFDNPQTIIGYDDDGTKVFRLFPEGDDIDSYKPPITPEDIPIVDTEIDLTSTRPVENQVIARAFASLQAGYQATHDAVAKLHVTPEMYGAIGDGKADDTEALRKAIEDNNPIIDLCRKSYVITDGIELKSIIKNGTIIYRGKADKPIFNVLNNGGLKDVTVINRTLGFASDVIRIDYTPYEEQFNPLTFVLNGLTIDNTIAEECVVDSCCIHFVYHKHKVLVNQNISNIDFAGKADYGIYIEPKLRNENDNPVFNTCVFSNVWFGSVNCALYVRPTMESGNVENAKGELKLTLINFANQHRDWITKPFIDVHNTEIEGICVIPWDYEEMTADYTYKTHNSMILLDMMHFGEITNKDVFYTYNKATRGEAYSNHPPFKMTELDANFYPLRSSGMNCRSERARFVSVIPEEEEYNMKHYGIMFQSSNGEDPKGNHICQLLTRPTSEKTTLWLRKFFPDTNTWGKRQQIYGEGSVPTSCYGYRTDGLSAGDMKFDTTVNKPVWWTGTKWVFADGTELK